MTTTAQPCRCKAYKFPHRMFSGKCGEREESAYVRGFSSSDDHRADDPRHGQAEHINRYR